MIRKRPSKPGRKKEQPARTTARIVGAGEPLVVPLSRAAGISPSATVTAASLPKDTGKHRRDWARAAETLPARRSVVVDASETSKKPTIAAETLPGPLRGGETIAGTPPSLAAGGADESSKRPTIAAETLPGPLRGGETIAGAPPSLAAGGADESSKRPTVAETLPGPGRNDETVAGAPPSTASGRANETLAYDAVATDSAPVRSGRAPLQPGSAGEPDFVLRELIGSGGQGEVWRAWQTSLSREVAVKRPRPGGDVGEFLMEALTTAELDHPNIVPVHDLGCAGPQGGELLIAMKFARGKPWIDLLKAERAASGFALEDFLAKHLRVLADVCDAVAYAHSKGIIHRDLKPQQVIVGEFGEVWLVDWGLAIGLEDGFPPPQPVRGGFPRRHTLRTASNQTGTPAYMAPEQTLESTRALGFHTDIYLLGAILFELVAGAPPREGETASEAYGAARENRVRSLPENCPPELAATIEKALASDPADRHASVEEFRADIEAWLTGSGRRGESREIAREADRLLRRGKGSHLSYSDLSRLRSRLDRALQLWPENPEAADLRRTALLAHAAKALGEGDLRFAESLAESLAEDDPERAAILEGVAEARRKAAREKRQRLVAFAACAVMLATMVGGSAFHAARLARERDASERARLDAEAARDEAELARRDAVSARKRGEKLIDFMFKDLRNELEPIGRLALVEKLSLEAFDYFADLPETSDPGDLNRRAMAVDNMASIFQARANYPALLNVLEETMRLGELLVKAEPDNPQRRRELAATRLNRGIALDSVGRSEEALEHLAQAEAELKELVGVEGSDSYSVARLLAQSRINTARALGNIPSRKEEAPEAWHKALDFGKEIAAFAPEDDELANAIVSGHVSLGVLLYEMGRPEETFKAWGEGLEMAREMSAREPENPHWRYEIASILSNIGSVMEPGERPVEAREALAEAAAILEELTAFDPENARWRRSRGQAMYSLGALMAVQGDYEGALAQQKKALEFFRSADPVVSLNDETWIQGVLVCTEQAAACCFQLERFDEARELLALARRDAARALDADGQVSEWAHLWLSRLGIYYNSACLASLDGNIEEGFELLEREAELSAQKPHFPQMVLEDSDLKPLREADPARFFGLILDHQEGVLASLHEAGPERRASDPEWIQDALICANRFATYSFMVDRFGDGAAVLAQAREDAAAALEAGGVVAFSAELLLGQLNIYYNSACLAAREGRTEEAFELFEKEMAVATDMGILETALADPDLEPLREGDPERFGKHLMGAAERIAALEAEAAAQAAQEEAAQETAAGEKIASEEGPPIEPAPAAGPEGAPSAGEQPDGEEHAPEGPARERKEAPAEESAPSPGPEAAAVER